MIRIIGIVGIVVLIIAAGLVMVTGGFGGFPLSPTGRIIASHTGPLGQVGSPVFSTGVCRNGCAVALYGGPYPGQTSVATGPKTSNNDAEGTCFHTGPNNNALAVSEIDVYTQGNPGATQMQIFSPVYGSAAINGYCSANMASKPIATSVLVPANLWTAPLQTSVSQISNFTLVRYPFTNATFALQPNTDYFFAVETLTTGGFGAIALVPSLTGPWYSNHSSCPGGCFGFATDTFVGWTYGEGQNTLADLWYAVLSGTGQLAAPVYPVATQFPQTVIPVFSVASPMSIPPWTLIVVGATLTGIGFWPYGKKNAN